jgi:hypothetical protein
VSFVLRRAGLLQKSRASWGLSRWRRDGRGRWITVYASPSHAFMVIGGKRYDTSPAGSGTQLGPRWRAHRRATGGFIARHAAGL